MCVSACLRPRCFSAGLIIFLKNAYETGGWTTPAGLEPPRGLGLGFLVVGVGLDLRHMQDIQLTNKVCGRVCAR